MSKIEQHNPTLGLSIPMYNEEGAAEQVLHQIMYVLRKADIPFKIAVVNNGSNDSTGRILDNLAEQCTEIIPIHFPENQGYGGGIQAGMRALTPHNCDIVGWMWGDGQILPDVLPRLTEAIQLGADIAKTRRTAREDGFKRKVISRCYATLLETTQNTLADVNGCPKLFTQSCWASLNVASTDWFIDAEAMLKAQQQGYQIHEEEVTMQKRLHNKSKVNVRTWIEFVVNIAKWNLHTR